MTHSHHLFRLLLITCFAAAFIQLSYPYPSYEDCAPSSCNNSTIKFPFQKLLTNMSAANCTDIAYVHCPDHQTTLLSFDSSLFTSEQFRILGGITKLSYTTQTIRLAPVGLFDCSHTLEYRSSVFGGHFSISDKYRNATILNCTKPNPYTIHLQQVECLHCDRTNNSCFILPVHLSLSYGEICSSYEIVIPADKNYNISAEKNLTQFLQGGFEVTWEIPSVCHACESSHGRCSAKYSVFDACICRDGVHQSNCLYGNLTAEPPHFHAEPPLFHSDPPHFHAEPPLFHSDPPHFHAEPPLFVKVNNKRRTSKTIAVRCGLIFGIGAAAIVFIISSYSRIKIEAKEVEEEQKDIIAYMDPHDSRPPSVENFLQGGIPTRYSYAQIKRYTNNFADRLGKGGFGTVFKGKLPNKCLAAIKILDKSEHSQDQFLNEVATVGRIHHIHLVRLLGYCFQGSKRALVYEYMVNGSLEKYIHGDDQNALDWKQLYSIALGTARGITYLHDECRSRILHCDIKPHNVLLDSDFSPKVADFGLAKLTDREESHISLTGARGTPGYVAPEVWSRNYGPVTDRSDVYSYGMLLMEMVGGRKNFDMRASKSSKFYYPEWAFKQVEIGEFGKLRGGEIVDETLAKKLSMLGLWCIQYNPSQRPPMSKVIQMLEGNVDIPVPPMPFPMDTPMQSIAFSEVSSTAY